MSASNDYFSGPQLKHPAEHSKKMLADPALATKIKRENPQLYKELRADAVAQGLLGPSRKESVAAMFAKPGHRTFDETELRARRAYTEEECRRFYVAEATGAKGSVLSKLKEDDPQAYFLLATAAWSYGLLPRRPEAPRGSETPIDEPMPLAPELCKKWSLPANTRVTSAEFYSLMETNNKLDQEAAEAAEAAEQAKAEAAAKQGNGGGAA